MTQWYYARGGQQSGPVTLDELRALARSGQLDAKDLVWNSGMADWLPASTVGGIIDGGAASANPYASPDSSFAAPLAVTEGVEIEPGSQPIGVMECIGRGFELTKRNFGIIFLTGLVYLGITLAIEIPLGAVDAMLGLQSTTQFSGSTPQDFTSLQASSFHPWMFVHQLISQIVALFLSLGLTRVGLNIVSGREVSVGQLFSQGDKLIRMIGASVIFYAAVLVGLVLLIVPGIYIALRFGQYPIAIVDKDLGVLDALKYSSRLTTNNRGNIFALILMNILIVFAGFLALCVGVIFAIPVTWLAAMVAYRWMQYGRAALLEQPVVVPQA